MSSQCSRPPKIRSSCSANSGGGTPSVGIMREIAITGKSIQQSIFSVHASVSIVSQETSVANGSKNTTARSRASMLSENHDNARLASSFLMRMSRPGYCVRSRSSAWQRIVSFSMNTSLSKSLSCISKAILGDPLCKSLKSSYSSDIYPDGSRNEPSPANAST